MSSCLHQAARSTLFGLTALIAPARVSDNSGVGPERRFDPQRKSRLLDRSGDGPSETAIKFWWSVRLSPPDYQCAAEVTCLPEFDFRYDAHSASLFLRAPLKRCAVVRQNASPIIKAELSISGCAALALATRAALRLLFANGARFAVRLWVILKRRGRAVESSLQKFLETLFGHIHLWLPRKLEGRPKI